MNASKRFDIQYLRAIAVISVILFHIYPNMFQNGHLGVDLFFLISGYLIFPQLLKAISAENDSLVRQEIRQFLFRRIKRISPALGFSVSLFMILGYFFLPPSVDYVNKQIFQSFSAIFGIGNLVALRQSGDYFNSNSPYVHFWTLGVEMQTYILASILAYFVYRVVKKRNRFSIDKIFYNSLVAITIVSLASRLVTLYFPEVFEYVGMQSFAIAPSSFDFYFTVNRLWEFTIGGCLALRNKNFAFLSPTLKLLTCCKNHILSIISFVIFMPIKILDANFTVTFLIFATGVYLMIPNQKKKSKLSTVSIWIGDRSYSLYLMHLPIITMLSGSFIPITIKPYFTVLALILTFLLGNLSYHQIEKRFRKSWINPPGNYSVKTQNNLLLIIISYLIPITLMSALFLKNIEIEKAAVSIDDWSKSYAASQFFPCPLGQLYRECHLSVKPKRENWLLVGDSHAGALQITLSEVAMSKHANLSVWNKCRFFDPQISSELNSYFPAWCVRQNTERIKMINSGKIDVLFVAYFNSEVNFGEKKLSKIMWASVFSKTLRNLNTNKVFVFSQIPSYADSTNDRPRLSFPAEQTVLIKNILNMSIIERNRDKEIVLSGGVNYIDITPAYCSKLKCVRKDRNWLYIDSNHLSIEGAKLIRPILESYMDEKI